MELFEKIKQSMLKPNEFFEKIKKEKGIGSAFKYLAILSLVSLVMGVVGLYTAMPFLIPNESYVALLPVVINFMPMILIFSYVFGLVVTFVSAGFIHIIAKLLKTKGAFEDTFKALVYGSTPSLLFSWIPFVSIIPVIYSLYLTIKGFSKLHSVSMGKAALIIFVIPLVLAVVAGFIFGFAFAATMMSLR